MKHLSRITILLITTVNVLFTGILIFTAYSPYISPQSHPVLSCIGLAFPIFLLADLLFLLFWLCIRRKFMLISLIGFLICFPQIRTYMPINFPSKSLPEKRLKIVSYNVMGFAGQEAKKGENPILSYLRASQADIICLQEYTAYSSIKSLTQKEIEKELKAYPYHRIQAIGNRRSANRLACYSKYPILSEERIDYKSDYNGSVAYEIKVAEDTLLVINNHLESNKLTLADKAVYNDIISAPKAGKVKEGSRQLVRKLARASAIRSVQVETIATKMASTKRSYLIVCGDFNDSPISYTHRVMSRNLADAFTQSGFGFGTSYNQNRFYLRIDNILISKNLKAYNCTVDKSIDKSDHYPIWCYVAKR